MGPSAEHVECTRLSCRGTVLVVSYPLADRTAYQTAQTVFVAHPTAQQPSGNRACDGVGGAAGLGVARRGRASPPAEHGRAATAGTAEPRASLPAAARAVGGRGECARSGEGEYARGGRGAAASSQHVAGDRLLPEPLACAGPGTVECGTGAVLFAAFEALSLSQSSPTRPPTALVPGVGPVPLPGNTCLGGLPLSGGLS